MFVQTIFIVNQAFARGKFVTCTFCHEYMSERSEGLPRLGREARGLGLEREDESLMLKMFMLLYADDIFSEGLQQALDALFDYCDKWSLRVNVDKTKIAIFSRKKI